MEKSLELLGLSSLLFASTNIDDIFVLVTFFVDPRFRTSQIIIGQYLGIAALTFASVAASMVSLVLRPEYVGLLGILPVLIGGKKLVDAWRDKAEAFAPEAQRPAGGLASIFTVASVTVANGGDNIGVYTPVFAARSAAELAGIGLVFAAMTAAWLAAGYGLVNHPKIGAPIKHYSRKVVPFILIGIGLMILAEAGSFNLLTTAPKAEASRSVGMVPAGP